MTVCRSKRNELDRHKSSFRDIAELLEQRRKETEQFTSPKEKHSKSSSSISPRSSDSLKLESIPENGHSVGKAPVQEQNEGKDVYSSECNQSVNKANTSVQECSTTLSNSVSMESASGGRPSPPVEAAQSLRQVKYSEKQLQQFQKHIDEAEEEDEKDGVEYILDSTDERSLPRSDGRDSNSWKSVHSKSHESIARVDTDLDQTISLEELGSVRLSLPARLVGSKEIDSYHTIAYGTPTHHLGGAHRQNPHALRSVDKRGPSVLEKKVELHDQKSNSSDALDFRSISFDAVLSRSSSERAQSAKVFEYDREANRSFVREAVIDDENDELLQQQKVILIVYGYLRCLTRH